MNMHDVMVMKNAIASSIACCFMMHMLRGSEVYAWSEVYACFEEELIYACIEGE